MADEDDTTSDDEKGWFEDRDSAQVFGDGDGDSVGVGVGDSDGNGDSDGDGDSVGDGDGDGDSVAARRNAAAPGKQCGAAECCCPEKQRLSLTQCAVS